MMRWANPFWLRIAVLTLLACPVIWFFVRQQRRHAKKLLGVAVYDFLAQRFSYEKQNAHFILQTIVLICFALALARPLIGSRTEEVKQSGIELILAIDVSNSMLAEDDKPSRLEHAKHELSTLVDKIGTDRIGLIAFAGSAILVSPITTDKSAIKMYINSVSTSTVSNQGTDFQNVVREAERAFDRGGVESETVKPTRVLLIASDGEDNEGGGVEAAAEARKAGFRIFAVGFGSDKGAPIPQRDDHGNLEGYLKDKSGQVVMSTPSDKTLGRMAEEGGGAYYHSSFDEGEIRQLSDDFDKLKKADFKSEIATDFDERFQVPLLLAILLGILEMVFGTRKNATLNWKGRWVHLVLIFAFVGFNGTRAHALGPPSVDANNKGVKAYGAQKYQESTDDFVNGLGRAPYNAQLHLNLGDAFYQAGDYDKAMAEYNQAARLAKGDSDVAFRGLFNAGNAAIQKKDINQALAFYQKALDIKPDSQEVKTNIELALAQQQGGGQGNDKQDQKDQNNQNQNQQKQSQKDDDQKNKEQQSAKNQPKPDTQRQSQPRPTPKPFNSKDLSNMDVNRILDELTRQEQEVRARQDLKNTVTPDHPLDKDW